MFALATTPRVHRELDEAQLPQQARGGLGGVRQRLPQRPQRVPQRARRVARAHQRRRRQRVERQRQRRLQRVVRHCLHAARHQVPGSHQDASANFMRTAYAL